MNNSDEWGDRIEIGLLEPAIRDPLGPELARVLRIIAASGLRELSSVKLRADARVVHQKYSGSLCASQDFLLCRLEMAGQSLTYAQYMAPELLCPPRGDRPIPMFARDTFRRVQDLVEDLRQAETLADHPRRTELLQRVDQVIEACRTRGFGRGVARVDDPLAIRLSALVESAVPDERIFMRCVQAHESIFDAGVVLTSQAIEAVSHGEVAEAIVALQWLESLEQLFTPLLRLLLAMSLDAWLALRPIIVLPSAIQGTRYHAFKANLPELARILDHPRVPRWERPNVPRCAELVQSTTALLRRWGHMHLGVVKKYTPGVSEGKSWQEKQVDYPQVVQGGSM